MRAAAVRSFARYYPNHKVQQNKCNLWSSMNKSESLEPYRIENDVFICHTTLQMSRMTQNKDTTSAEHFMGLSRTLLMPVGMSACSEKILLTAVSRATLVCVCVCVWSCFGGVQALTR